MIFTLFKMVPCTKVRIVVDRICEHPVTEDVTPIGTRTSPLITLARNAELYFAHYVVNVWAGHSSHPETHIGIQVIVRSYFIFITKYSVFLKTMIKFMLRLYSQRSKWRQLQFTVSFNVYRYPLKCVFSVDFMRFNK